MDKLPPTNPITAIAKKAWKLKWSNLIFYVCLLHLLCLVAGCESPREETSNEIEAPSAPTAKAPPIPIKTVPAKRMTFKEKVISTGQLSAARQADISMPIGGLIMEMPIEAGTIIGKGDLMVQLDETALQLQLKEYQFAFEDAELKKNDLLIANSGQAGVDTSVNPQKLKLIIIESGYERAKHNIKKGEHELAQATLFAPFRGIVADVMVNKHQQISAGQQICKLIDPNSFQVVFQVLEHVAIQLKKGQKISLSPNARPDLMLSALIHAINPIVNENGLVEVRANLSPRKGFQPIEGLKVKISIEKNIPNQIVIPKSALVIRSGRNVVFVHDPATDLAKWKYVEVAYENDQQIAISKGIEADEMVIFDGNLNLAHDAEVVVAE